MMREQGPHFLTWAPTALSLGSGGFPRSVPGPLLHDFACRAALSLGTQHRCHLLPTGSLKHILPPMPNLVLVLCSKLSEKEPVSVVLDLYPECLAQDLSHSSSSGNV